jgi:hypothetical protein
MIWLRFFWVMIALLVMAIAEICSGYPPRLSWHQFGAMDKGEFDNFNNRMADPNFRRIEEILIVRKEMTIR